jgi:hypothetical protein
MTRLLILISVLAAGVASAHSAPPPHVAVSTGLDFWGQPSSSAEIADRPLGHTLGLFRAAGAAASLPMPSAGPSSTLAAVAARLRGHPGALLLSQARRVVTAAGPVYLVPTTRGWLCVQGPNFRTCHHGLLRQGITWSFYSTAQGLSVIGIAADGVARVSLVYGKQRREATLHDNVFYVARPITFGVTQRLPPLGRLVVAYRDRAHASAQVPLG